MEIAEPICFKCKRYYGGWACQAFLEGIPKEIQTMQHDHRQTFPGDRGIKFERMKQEG